MISENRIVPYKTVDLPSAEGPWMVFAPHADDESFGMGGTIARAVERGIKVIPVIMTKGELGGQEENLVETRKQEAIRAAEILGMETPQFLGYSDRRLQLNDQTVAHVLEKIEVACPAAIFFPGVFELHPDHRTTTGVVWQALRKLNDPDIVPVSYEVLVQSPVNCLVDITNTIENKRKAMAVYQSQLTENNYIEITLALNKLRTLTLPSETTYAEGFFCYSPISVHKPLWEFIAGEIVPYFDP